MVPSEIRFQLDAVQGCRPRVVDERTKTCVTAGGERIGVCEGKHDFQRLPLDRRNLEVATRIGRGHDRRGVGHFKLVEEARKDKIGASGGVATGWFTGTLENLQIGKVKSRLVLSELHRK
jgi:hypothetical protein